MEYTHPHYMVTLLAFLVLGALIALFVSLIKPNLILRKYGTSRKKSTAIFGGLFLLFFILFGIVAPPTETKVNGATISPTISVSNSPTPTVVITKTPIPTKFVTKTPTKIPTKAQVYVPTSKPAQQQPVNQNTNTYSGGDKDCSDFASQGEAQAYFNSKGGSATNNVDRLDRDGDGVVCESN